MESFTVIIGLLRFGLFSVLNHTVNVTKFNVRHWYMHFHIRFCIISSPKLPIMCLVGR